MTRPERSEAHHHLDYLDGWRGLAITFLLIGHFSPFPGINFGQVGVNLFFVLSGFLMGQLLFIKHTPLPVFYRRRISRIVPAHIVFILCITVFYFLTNRSIDWYETFAALFFVNNYFVGEPGKNVMPFGHLWSLSVEEHSYIVLSLIAIASRKSKVDAKWIIAGFAVLFSAMGFWYWRNYSGPALDFDKWLHSEVSAYGIFISAAILLVLAGRRTPALPTLPALAYPALFSAGVLLHWWSVPSPIRTTVGLGILALTVSLLANAPPIIKRALSFRPLRWMGLWSFSIYLWQQPFYLASHSGAIPKPLAIALALGCGVASYYLLEQPVRSYLNRTWGRQGSQLSK